MRYEHIMLNVFYPTRNKLRKISARDREKKCRLVSRGICERASERGCRARQKKESGHVMATADKRASHVYQTPSSEVAKTFAQRTELRQNAPLLLSKITSNSSIAQIRVCDEQSSCVHSHRAVVYAASSSQLVACLAVCFDLRALLHGQTGGVAEVPLCFAARAAAALSTWLTEVVVALTAVEVGRGSLVADLVASAV
jgi:hypothetical protein